MSSSFVPLVPPSILKKYKNKAARLESLIRTEDRAKHPEISQRVALLRKFYVDVQKKAAEKLTKKALAEFKQEEETMAQHEDAFINYVVIRAPQKAMVEKQSSAYL